MKASANFYIIDYALGYISKYTRKVLCHATFPVSQTRLWQEINNSETDSQCEIDHLKCVVRYRKNSRRRIGAVRRANRIYIRIIFNSICIYFYVSCLRPHYYHINKTIFRYRYFSGNHYFAYGIWGCVC